jgi:hypothetical protein
MFRSLFHDHPQGSSFVLSAPTAYQPPASSFVFLGFVAVCPLFVCVSGVPVCVLSCRALHDQTTHRQVQVFRHVHHRYIPIYVYIQQDATLHSLFISGNGSTCFEWYFHPLSGAHTTVSTASGRYSCMRSWWWGEVPPETCTVVSRYK